MVRDPSSLAFVAKSFPELSASDPGPLFERFAALVGAHRAWAIEDDGGHLLGHVELKPTAKVHPGELELVYIVRTEARGKGVATAAVRLAASNPCIAGAWAIVAFIHPRNAASRRVVEKAGFRRKTEGASGCRYALDLRRRAQ
jgi:RimJ/RimL family protein N-acetyltransferase